MALSEMMQLSFAAVGTLIHTITCKLATPLYTYTCFVRATRGRLLWCSMKANIQETFTKQLWSLNSNSEHIDPEFEWSKMNGKWKHWQKTLPIVEVMFYSFIMLFYLIMSLIIYYTISQITLIWSTCIFIWQMRLRLIFSI